MKYLNIFLSTLCLMMVFQPLVYADSHQDCLDACAESAQAWGDQCMTLSTSLVQDSCMESVDDMYQDCVDDCNDDAFIDHCADEIWAAAHPPPPPPSYCSFSTEGMELKTGFWNEIFGIGTPPWRRD